MSAQLFPQSLLNLVACKAKCRTHTHGEPALDPALRDRLPKRAAINPPNKRRMLKLPISGWATTVAPSPIAVALRFVFPGPPTLPLEGSADHFTQARPV